MFLHYLKIAFRNMWKYKSQSVVNTLGLAFGLVCFTLGWHWLRWETSFDSCFPNAPNICVVTQTDEDNEVNYAQYQTARQVVTQVPEIHQTSWIQKDFTGHFQYDSRALSLNFSVVDSSFVNLFQFEFISGNVAMFKQVPASAVLTHTAAIQLFGDEDPIGKQVQEIIKQIWGEPIVHEYTVVGVIKDLPEHTNFNFDLLVHAEKPPSSDEYEGVMFCLLYPGTDLKKVKDRLSGISLEKQPGHVGIVSLADMRPLLMSYNMKYGLPFVRIFTIASLLAFLGAIFNFVSLTFSRTVNRNNEFRLRLTLGSSNGQLTLLLAFEIILSVLIAFFVAVMFIKLMEQPFEWLSGVDTSGIYGIIIWSGWLCLTIISLLYLIFHNHLLSHRRIFSSRFVVQRIMCVGQIIIASLFMTIAIVVYAQTKYLTTRDIGMEVDNIVCLYLGLLTSQEADPQVVKSQLLASPSISDVLVFPEGIIKSPGAAITQVSWNEQNEPMSCGMSYIPDDRFFDFFKVKLKKGRFINTTDARKCMINETAAKQIGIDTVGIHLTLLGLDFEVVGIIKDLFSGSTHEPTKPAIYIHAVSYSDRPDVPEIMAYLPSQNRYYIKVHPSHRSLAWEQIQQVMNNHHADDLSECAFLEDQLAEIFRQETLTFRLFGILTATSLLISTFGIYAMVSLTTRRRRKEIAIRKVAGAEVIHITGIFAREYLGLVLLANSVALPVAFWLMNRWLQSYAYHIDIHWWVLVAVLVFNIIIVLSTVLGQVLKAANDNPAEVVKYE